MPKHGWKYRTERLRKFSPEQIEILLRETSVYQVSGKLARWIFENLGDRNRILALERIAEDERATWARSYLWNLLEKHKHEPFGDWVVVVLTRSGVCSARDADRFIDLYRDERAHLETQGSAVFGLSNSVCYSKFDPEGTSLSSQTWERALQTCSDALRDSNPYARAGACWLAQHLDAFHEEVIALRQDRTRCVQGGGCTVADHAEDWPP
jgi:hypothetical protein